MSKLPFAKKDNGELVYISDLKRGEKVYCPYCDGQLIGKKGKIIQHHFAHKEKSCLGATNSKFLVNTPFFEFLRLGLTNAQISNLNDFYDKFYMPDTYYKKPFFWEDREEHKALWSNYRVCKYPEFFKENKFIRHKSNDIYHIDTKTKVVLCRLELKEYYKYCKSISMDKFQSSLEQSMLELMITRMRVYKLYFIRVKTPIYSAKRFIYKIGVTQRELKDRLKEIRSYLQKKIGQHEIKVIKELEGAGFVEPYFKAKFQKFNYADLGTEYYVLNNEDANNIQSELSQLNLITDAHKQKIKTSIIGTNVGKRGGDKAFLEKDKSKRIIEFLEQGLSLRKVAEAAGCSVNLVRKVKSQLN